MNPTTIQNHPESLDPIETLKKDLFTKFEAMFDEAVSSLKRQAGEPEARDIKMHVHVEHVDREEPEEESGKGAVITEAHMAALKEFHRLWKFGNTLINGDCENSQIRVSFDPRPKPLKDPTIGSEPGEVYRPDPREDFVWFEADCNSWAEGLHNFNFEGTLYFDL